MNFKSVLTLLLLAFLNFNGKCQSVFVYGKVYDAEFPNLQLQQVMIVNQQSQIGIFGGNDNSFQIQINRNDTIIISALGYARKKVCLKDSAALSELHISIGLNRLSYDLSEITVRRQRE
ncbi:MAG: hypothetical protein RLZZ94_1571, partial [Bacteroidota bacterium]